MDGGVADEKPRSDRPREKKKKKKSRPKPENEEQLQPPVAAAEGKPDAERKERKKKKKKSSRHREEAAPNGEVPPQAAEKPPQPSAAPNGEEMTPEMAAQKKKLEAAKEREMQRRKEEKERKRRERKERERRQREEEERKKREEEERQRAAQEAQRKGQGDDEDDEYGDEDFEDYSEDDFEADEEAKVLEASSPPPIAKTSPVVSGLRKKTDKSQVLRASTQDLREIQEQMAKQNAAAKERIKSRPPQPKAAKGQFTMIQPSASPVRQRPGSSNSSSSFASDRPRTARAAKMYKDTNVAASMAKFASKGNMQRAKRVKDLNSLVNLEEEKFVTINQMPVSSYEMYVRKLRGTLGVIKQVACQSNEDDRTIEVQTEEIETKEQEAQFSLGDDTEFENILQALRDKKSIEKFKKSGNTTNTAAASLRLTSFIQQASQVCEAVCEKNVEQYNKHFTDESESKDDSNNLFLDGSKWIVMGQQRRLSQSESNADLLAQVLYAREVTGLHFSRLQPNMVCSSYMSRTGTDDPLEDCGLLCIWNTLSPGKPSRFGISRAGLTCCTLGHFQTHIVMAGTIDGQILLWDLRESKREIQAQQDEFQKVASKLCTEGVVRSPAYTSSSLGPTVNSHTSRVISIAPIPVEILSRSSDGASRASFQAASLDDRGLLALWLVTEIEKIEPGGSSKDLGLAISGRIRLVLSRTLWVDPSREVPQRRLSGSGMKNTLSFKPKKSNPKQQPEDPQEPGPAAQAVAFYPKDPNRFIAALSDGEIVQGARFGSCPPPKIFQVPISFGSFENAPVPVTCLHFSPFIPEYFLAGCQDGTVRLYSILESIPVMHWVSDCFTMEEKITSFLIPPQITQVYWSAHRPSVFYVLNRKAELYVFDLLQKQNEPVFAEKYEGSTSGVDLHSVNYQNLVSLSEEKVKVGRPRLVMNNGASVIWRTLSNHLVTPHRDVQWETRELSTLFSSALL